MRRRRATRVLFVASDATFCPLRSFVFLSFVVFVLLLPCCLLFVSLRRLCVVGCHLSLSVFWSVGCCMSGGWPNPFCIRCFAFLILAPAVCSCTFVVPPSVLLHWVFLASLCRDRLVCGVPRFGLPQRADTIGVCTGAHQGPKAPQEIKSGSPQSLGFAPVFPKVFPGSCPFWARPQRFSNWSPQFTHPVDQSNPPSVS